MDAPAVAVRDAEIAVAWMDRRARGADIWFATAARGRFEPEAPLHRERDAEQRHPHVVAAPKGFVAAWTHGGPRGWGRIHARLADGTQVAVSPEGADSCGYARLAAAGDAVWVAYQQGDGAGARVVVQTLR